MKKDTIVQFVCFETNVAFDEFVLQWERYAKRFLGTNMEITLQQQTIAKCRFRYISQHESPEDDFQFVFMQGRHSEHFPEHNAKVVQAGGYTPVQIECLNNKDNDDVKIMVLISKAKTGMPSLDALPAYRYLNIYQAYYESCMYAYVFEFFVSENHASDLLHQLKSQIHNAEIGAYKECLVLDA